MSVRGGRGASRPRFGIVLARRCATTAEAIGAATGKLCAWAEELRGEYEGWQTSVES